MVKDSTQETLNVLFTNHFWKALGQLHQARGWLFVELFNIQFVQLSDRDTTGILPQQTEYVVFQCGAHIPKSRYDRLWRVTRPLTGHWWGWWMGRVQVDKRMIRNLTGGGKEENSTHTR